MGTVAHFGAQDVPIGPILATVAHFGAQEAPGGLQVASPENPKISELKSGQSLIQKRRDLSYDIFGL